jgi:uncharacterized lipoprotein YmbA
MIRTALLILLAASIAACASLEPRPDRSRYYTLPPASAAATSAAPLASLGLGPVTLPPYVDRPEIATRVGAAEVAYGPDARWAAPLAEMVPRALAEDLRGRLPARDVIRWPWPLGSPPEVAVAVDLLRFEADAAGGATLEARWTVAVRGRAPATGETRVREAGPAGDAAASVAALGRALGALAADLAAAARAPAR